MVEESRIRDNNNNNNNNNNDSANGDKEKQFPSYSKGLFSQAMHA